MDKETKELLEQVVQRLDVANALLLRLVPKNNDVLTLKEQLQLLDGLKVRPVDMARITGRKPGHINKELVSIRKKK